MWKQIRLHFKQAGRITKYIVAVSIICFILPVAGLVFAYNSISAFIQIAYIIMLILMLVICFIEANTQGIRDKRKVSMYKRYPLKGFVLGFAAQFFPWVITFLLLFFKNAIFVVLTETAQNFAANICLLQFTNIMLLFDYRPAGYIISVLAVPVVCMAGYLLSYINIDVDDRLGGIRKT